MWPFSKALKVQETQEETITLYVKVQKGFHKKPASLSYNGGFDEISICNECGAHALLLEWHALYPCPLCGGRASKNVGKWNKDLKRWIVRGNDAVKRGSNPEDFV